ncbi:hypothetical protein GF354_01445 [Candidatus Peregrinibacteria bacterium]|nr:hypothetical protein [Candidatus Peregrinibacteria bacterium]
MKLESPSLSEFDNNSTPPEPIYAPEFDTVKLVQELISSELFENTVKPRQFAPTLEEEEKFLKLFDKNTNLSKPSKFVRIFEMGSKALILHYYGIEFSTIIVTTNENPQIEGETTALYQAAKDEMTRLAKEKGKLISYYLRTSNPHMIAWAKTKGAKIFDWLEVTPAGYKNPSWIFKTKINPFSSSSSEQDLLNNEFSSL